MTPLPIPYSTRRLFRRFRDFYERGRYGYSRRDWWSFDIYICGVIGRACQDFKGYGNGFPGGMTESEWNQLLEDIYVPLLEWHEHRFEYYDLAAEEFAYEQAKEAMHKFAEHLGAFWD